MTISEIVSFLNSKGFGKRERSYRLSFFSIPFSCYVCIFFCGLCALSLVVDHRIKVKLDLFVLQELGRDFEKIS